MIEDIIKLRNYCNGLLMQPLINVQTIVDKLDAIIKIGTRQYFVYVDHDNRTEVWFIPAAIDEDHADRQLRAFAPWQGILRVKEAGNHPIWLGSVAKEEDN